MTQIQTVLGLASSAVGLTGQATATVDAIKNLFTGDKKADSSETQQLLNNLASQLTSANMMNVQLSTILKEIAATIDKDNKFNDRLSRYKLIRTDHGDMIYVLRDEFSNSEPIHHICPICIEKNARFHFVVGSIQNEGKHCQGCNHFFQFNQFETNHRYYDQ